MSSAKQILRLLQINYILAKNGLDQVIVSIRLFSMFRFIIYLNPWNWFRFKNLSRGEALRKSLEELGPVFVKFGQTLSTRPDLLPKDIAVELCQLQDNVPPFESSLVLAILEKSFGVSAHEVFAKFDEKPLASASIAQVHAATLKTGEEVVVKILRPDIQKVIVKDIKILKTIAKLADRYSDFGRRLKPKEIVLEFEKTILNELDLHREAANASQLRRNFKDSPLLYVPIIYWDYVTTNILVMERVHGIGVDNIEELKRHDIDLKKLAERGLEIFFLQVFRDCFFHADMHPGNIFVAMNKPTSPQYICVDFGIIGTLTDNDKSYLAENMLAFFNRDYKKIAKLHIESGWIAKDTREDEFENAIRTVCEPIFERPLKEISFGMVILRLFQVAKSFEMHVQPQLALLQKTLFAVEGLGRQIYPDLNLWNSAKPFLEQWVKEQVGVKAMMRNLYENVPFITQHLPYMPRLINDVLLQLKNTNSGCVKKSKQYTKARVGKSIYFQVFNKGFFLSSAILASICYFGWLDYEDLTTVTLGASLASGLIAIFTIKK